MDQQENLSTMRSLAIQKYCKPSEYQILELPKPKLKDPEDILIKVHAASINPVDVKVASGMAKMVWPTE
jgi:NADPH:quinone reductase-like Zn-dependent oxidoreductase